MFVGNQHLVRDFKNLIKADKLAHSYIFFGEPEIGKFYFTKHLANFLENNDFELSKRPLQDALFIENTKSIDAMRELKKFLWEKPVISSKRLVVINDIQNFTPQAQNAILKITEEPPENAFLILVVNQLDNILPPLLSRSQKIYFTTLSDVEMLEVIKDKKIISISYGKPGRAMRLENDPLTKEARKYSKNFLDASGSQRSKIIKEIITAQKDEPKLLDLFFEEVILDLHRDPENNSHLLKSVLNRFSLIKSYNTNKRLQIEAIN
ncbi:AAA family ATPase [Candidatus Wolfebacteria bacterium]|nr:AAA family ATPase [Candidatus Wolfebacteria bacterium]